MKLCSACLLGIACRYDGKSKPNDMILEYPKGMLIPVCPEQLGGLPTPRHSSEILGGDGHDVISGKARVIQQDNSDVTSYFIRGAKEMLRIARAVGADEAIMKQRSPSCGCGQIYDGTFTKRIIEGDGVATALLKRNGIRVISEEEL